MQARRSGRQQDYLAPAAAPRYIDSVHYEAAPIDIYIYTVVPRFIYSGPQVDIQRSLGRYTAVPR